jgi:hypothetical protein
VLVKDGTNAARRVEGVKMQTEVFLKSGSMDSPVLRDFVPLVDAGDPRRTFWTLLDLYADRCRSLWRREEVTILRGQITDFYLRYDGRQVWAWRIAWERERATRGGGA